MPATAAPPPPAPPAEERSLDSFDLTGMQKPAPDLDFHAVRKTCDPAAARPGEIVVCAPDPEQNRLRPLAGPYTLQDGPPRAEWNLGGGVALDVHAESATMPDGAVAKRLMTGVKLKF